jgi:hypothetical protein
MKKYLLLLFWGISWGSISAQNFKDEELIKFYHLYQYELSNPFDLPTLMPRCVAKSKISEQRMTEIMQAQAMGKNPKLTESEKQEMEKIQKCLQIEKDKYDAEFVKKIKEKGLTQKRYEEIKSKFVQDKTLQQKTYQLVQK